MIGAALSRSDPQAASHLRPSHPRDRIGVPHDDQPVGRPRQADVQALGGAVAGSVLIDAQHNGTTFHAFEAEDAPVEDVVAVPVEVPIAPLPERLLPLALDRVACAQRDQRDVPGVPPFREERLDLFVCGV